MEQQFESEQNNTVKETGQSIFRQELIPAENIKTFDLLSKNGIGNKIFWEINKEWHRLNEVERKKITTLINDLLDSLANYRETFINLEKSSARTRMLHFDDIEKFKQNVKNADERERIAHNLFIDSLNILSRNMKSFGLDNSWRGEEEIYDVSQERMREKTRNWMLKNFKELV